MDNNSTIAAISTGMTNAGIGIVRVSGCNAIEIVNSIFKEKDLTFVPSHTVHYGHIEFDGEILDEVLVMILKAPKTFTAEDTVEIDCHGGVLVTRKVLEACLKRGARPAEPGEFTKRAFLNGRIDLSQAESVMDVISAQNDFALKSSMNQLSGSLSREIKELRSKILYETSFIESALDDPEHFDLTDYPVSLEKKIDDIILSLNKLIASSDNGSILKSGIRTAIVGKPNAGKSSLLNLLAGKERAIVTDIPGTTRDTLEEQINIEGITLNIIDTAGIRSTEDIVEKIGVEKAINEIEEADLVIYVIDASDKLDDSDLKILDKIKNKKSIILLNKTDLNVLINEDSLKEYSNKQKIINFSAKEEIGLDELVNEIKEMFFTGEIDLNEEIFITNARHKFALEKANNSLKLVKTSIENAMPEDFFSIDLMDAYASLGEVIGEEVTEDLVEEIFSKFCMGK